MDIPVDLGVKKAGIPAATAKTIIALVVNYLKKKLPGSACAQIDKLLEKSGTVETA